MLSIFVLKFHVYIYQLATLGDLIMCCGSKSILKNAPYLLY